MLQFGPYRISEESRQLLCHEQVLKLEKIPFDILLLLIRERDRVVSREEIAECVWGPDRYVEAADGINTAIRKIRKSLDDNADEPQYIQTLIGRGYRFIGDVVGAPEVKGAVTVAPATALQSGHLSRKWIVGAGVLVACVLVVGLTVPLRESRGRDSQSRLVRLTSDSGFTGWPDISADGKLLAYASNRMDPDNLDIYIQPTEGNEPIQLTKDPARDEAPVISPRGDQIAFESHREPAGIYVVPLLGGEARLLAKDGLAPRYSPDGAWVSYYKVPKTGGGTLKQMDAHEDSGSWLVSAGGGEPRALRPELVSRHPIWAGNDFLILTGHKEGSQPDWWVTPKDGSWAKTLGVYPVLRQNIEDIAAGWSTWTPSYFENGTVVFSARTRVGANLWRLPFTKDWEPQFPPQRVTMMSDHVISPTASANGRIAAAVMSRNNDVYEIPMDTNAGLVKGVMIRLTRAKTSEQFASISTDASLIAYTSWRNGDPGDLYLLDRKTGTERQLTATKDWESFPRISPDHSFLFYKWVNDSTKEQETRRLDIQSGSVETICHTCTFMDRTADGKSYLYGDFAGRHIYVRDFAGGEATEPVAGDKVKLWNASLDSANRWIAFIAEVPGESEYAIYAAPYRRDARLGRKDWIKIGTGWTPVWSPNGEWLYFDEGHESFRCLWGQKFDPVAGRPVGKRISVAHIHGDKHMLLTMNYKDRGVARDRIVFSLTETTSNIWMMK